MARVEGPGVFVETNVVALASSEPGVVDLHWNGWLPTYSLLGRTADERARVHGVNVANRRLSVEAFGRFLERWVAAAGRCATEDEIVALGRPRVPDAPGEPGALPGERADLDSFNGPCKRLLREALAEVDRLRAGLAGRRRPLDVRPDLRLALEVKGHGRSCRVAASASGGVAAGCRTTAGVGARVDPDGRASTTLTAGPVTVTAAGDRIESVELAAGGAYARLGASSAAAGLGARRELVATPDGVRVSAEARLGVEVELLDAETVRRALSHEDFWAKKR
jgi:hypothetical protein